MFLQLDFKSDDPIYMQIKNQIIWGIASGELQREENLPSVRQLAADIGINLHTVNKAYNLLKDEGYIAIDRRVGAKVETAIIAGDSVFKQQVNMRLKYLLAECKLKGLSEEDMKDLLSGIFTEMEKETKK